MIRRANPEHGGDWIMANITRTQSDKALAGAGQPDASAVLNLDTVTLTRNAVQVST